MTTKLFSDDDWCRRFDNQEVLIRSMGVQICDLSNYVFKLEEKVKTLELKQKINEDVFKRIGEKL